MAVEVVEKWWANKLKGYEYRNIYSKHSVGSKTTPVNGIYVKPGRYDVWVEYDTQTVIQQRHGYFGLYQLVGSYVDPYIKTYEDKKSLNNLINKALRGGADVKVELGMTLAESQSTFNMIGNNSRTLAEMFRRLRSGNLRGAFQLFGRDAPFGARNKAGSVANRYLELIFGWMPLVEEIYNGMDYISSGVNADPDNMWVTLFAKGEYTGQVRAVDEQRWGMINPMYDLKLGAHCKMNFAWTHAKRNQTLYDLGLANPALIGWGYLPWSFLVDWFLPVSDYLGAFTGTNGMRYVDGYITDFGDVSLDFGLTPPPDVHAYLNTRDESPRWITTSRRIIYDPTPRLPQLRLPTSLWHAITGAALVTQQAVKR